MKKLSKLVLLVLTVVSGACFLFYKYQYDKLYNVLEVLEFFGAADKTKPFQDAHRYSRVFNPALDGRPPAWQMLHSDAFVYEPHCSGGLLDSETGKEPAASDIFSCPRITGVALMSDASQAGAGCKIWYEDKYEPHNGIFAASSLDSLKSEETYKSCIFTCDSKFPDLVPRAVSLFLSNGSTSVMAATTVNLGPSAVKGFQKSGLVACIGPSASMDPSVLSLSEQVLLQNHLGIENFIIYDSGSITNMFLNTIHDKRFSSGNMSSSSSLVQPPPLEIKILPWNYPFPGSSSSSSRLARTDCHFRTRSAFESWVYLESHQLLVPKSSHHHPTVHRLLRDMSARSLSQGNKIGGKYQLHVRRFCSEYPLDTNLQGYQLKSQLLSLTKLTYNAKMSLSTPRVSLMHKMGAESQEIDVSPKDATVHDYSPCGIGPDDESNAMRDDTLLGQAEAIESSIGTYFLPLKGA